MRTSKINLLGAEYTLCFSAGVMIACDEKYGGVDKAMQEMGAGKFEPAFWLLYQMMLAGKAYCEINHIESPELKPYDYLLNMVGVDELTNIHKSITETVQNGQKRNFEVEYKGKHKSKKKTTKSRREQSESSISTKD